MPLPTRPRVNYALAGTCRSVAVSFPTSSSIPPLLLGLPYRPYIKMNVNNFERFLIPILQVLSLCLHKPKNSSAAGSTIRIKHTPTAFQRSPRGIDPIAATRMVTPASAALQQTQLQRLISPYTVANHVVHRGHYTPNMQLGAPTWPQGLTLLPQQGGFIHHLAHSPHRAAAATPGPPRSTPWHATLCQAMHLRRLRTCLCWQQQPQSTSCC